MLDALAEDPRASVRELAKRVHLSESIIASRLRQLTEQNVFRVALQREVSCGPTPGVRAILELYLTVPPDISTVAAALVEFEEIPIVYETARRPELCCNVHVADIASLNRLVSELAERVPTLTQLNALPILASKRLRRTIVNLEYPSSDRVRPSETEGALIYELETDARQPVSSLARKLGLSPTATRYRIEKLIKEKGYGIRLLTDASAMGYSIWADLRLTIEPHRVSEAIERVGAHKDVIIISHLSGPANLQVFVVARHVIDLDTFIHDEIRILSGLRSYEIMRVPRVWKYNRNIVFT